MNSRIVRDSYGEVHIPTNKLWGIQTQRNKEHFIIGRYPMPYSIIECLLQIKKAAAQVNYHVGKLSEVKYQAISQACNQLLTGDYQENFPLKVYQTGSGTQTNMNVNEVIATMCQQNGVTVHPNDDVNMSQSSNDTFPTAMHLATLIEVNKQLLPVINKWSVTLKRLEEESKDTLKIGRTHLQDATPMTFGQEVSAWRTMIERNQVALLETLNMVKSVAIGGTAVGTGLNAPDTFDDLMVKQLSKQLDLVILAEPNKFYGLSSHTPLVYVHGALRCLATDLMKIANDIRWLASGPRTGLGELTIPSNEAGSSIMPGKVNPTQAEALIMAMCTVFGNDTTIQIANSQGNFQLNVFKPVMIDKLLESIELMSQSMTSFHDYCLVGLQPNHEKMAKNVEQSLMIVTALTPHLGYDRCTEIAKYASTHDMSIREVVLKFGDATEEELTRWIDIRGMV